MESEKIVNTVIVWLFPSLMLIIWYFFKKDQRTKEVEMKEMKKEFRAFMLSQSEINQKNTEILIKLQTIQEMGKD
jgi:hypothetical protein